MNEYSFKVQRISYWWFTISTLQLADVYDSLHIPIPYSHENENVNVNGEHRYKYTQIGQSIFPHKRIIKYMAIIPHGKRKSFSILFYFHFDVST